MKINEIYQIMEKFEASSLSEMCLEMEGVKFSAKKGSRTLQANTQATVPATALSEVGTPMDMVSHEVPEDNTGINITAPLVGTFYHAAAPGEKPFVTQGQQVKKGDVMGMIEAMKLMNEITAPQDGVVVSIEAEDGELVEYGQILIRLR